MAYKIPSLEYIFLVLLMLGDQSIVLDSLQSNFSGAGCIEMERQALLTFKRSLKDPLDWLSSWIGKDCCKWMGVVCNNQTGNVVKLDLRNSYICILFDSSDEAASRNISCLGGTLNPSLLNLTYLNHLDLSQNSFQGITIPEFIGSLKNLKYLNLSRASFSGLVPPHLGNLSELIHLDLTTSSYSSPWVSDTNWLSGLSSLQYLGMESVNLSKSSTNWMQAVNMLPSLLELHLSFSQLQGIPQHLPIVNLTSLMALDLSVNNFCSPIPQWLFNISTFVNLNLQNSKFTGQIPEIASGSFCNLSSLDLSSNFLGGQINHFFDALSGCNNHSLQNLDLSSNNLIGDLPDSLFLHKNLNKLPLQENSFSGPLSKSVGNLSSLSMLDLSFNRMKGSIPETIGQLALLYQLQLYKNSWEGIMTEIHFQNLSRLYEFSLSSVPYALTFNVRPDWTPTFSLHIIAIDGCRMGPVFPKWLQTQNQISEITLSNVLISDTIPGWLWKFSPSIFWLDLSANQLRGRLPKSISMGSYLYTWIDLGFNRLEGSVPLWSNITDLSLRHNKLSGPIPLNFGQVMSRLVNLDLSNNLLNGSIPRSLNRLENLQFLDLSNNYLSGNIPSNLKGMQFLWILDLSSNKLSGDISNSICLLPVLFLLNLKNNNLSGVLSSTLQNCTNLLSLDVGYNRFTGTLSAWIADNSLPLTYIGLRGNMLTGNVPEQLCGFPNLHILDLAENNLSGSIPKCLGNVTAWKSLATVYVKSLTSINHIEFSQHIELVVKGRKNEYTKIIPLVNALDISHNNLSGEIPQELTNLSGLGFLNLSWNRLSGQIPHGMGNLRYLESLDLSWNHISGPIPPSMPSMTSLNYLNLSYNNLSGQIPSTNQFLTFNDTSFEGNPELCGPPLPVSCTNGTVDRIDNVESEYDDDRDDNFWFYVSMGLGFIVGFWVVCGTLVLKKSWRYAYFNFVDEMKDRLILFIYLTVASLKRRFVK